MKIDKADYNEIYRLIKLSQAEDNDVTSINTLYKKYINSLAPDGCKCNGVHSISEYWERLRDFYVTVSPDESDEPKSEKSE